MFSLLFFFFFSFFDEGKDQYRELKLGFPSFWLTCVDHSHNNAKDRIEANYVIRCYTQV